MVNDGVNKETLEKVKGVMLGEVFKVRRFSSQEAFRGVSRALFWAWRRGLLFVTVVFSPT